MLLQTILMLAQTITGGTPQTITGGTARAAVLFQPIAMKTTRSIFGRARQRPGLWTVAVCNRMPAALTVQRAELLMLAPALPVLPNTLAEDLAGRNAASDPSTVIGTQGSQAVNIGTSLATGIGIATKSTNTVYAAAATSILMLAIQIIGKSAPAPAPYFSQLMPDSITLAPAGCQTFYLFASPIRAAAPIGPLNLN